MGGFAGVKTVWKYAIPVHDLPTIRMQRGAQLLHVAPQGSELCVWALVDPQAQTEDVTLRILGTGHPATDKPGRYIGTAHMMGGALVWHVFQVSP
jgi:hypothetical protein